MSYILEALRRAERERAQGEATSGAPTALDADRNIRRSRLLIVLVALLAINAVVLVAYLLRGREKVAQTAAPPVATSAPMPATAPAPVAPPTEKKNQALIEENVNSLDDLGAQPDVEGAA